MTKSPDKEVQNGKIIISDLNIISEKYFEKHCSGIAYPHPIT